MTYVVLARKWRPQSFEDLTGQAHVAQTLSNAIEQDRVPHAVLFTGARGVGKTSTARILAMALNCAKGPTVRPCGECDPCTEIQRSSSVDVLEIDGASNRGINEIRELRDGVRYAPHRDRYKIHIIDEVHMLTTEAFNALLKTLEEPPEHVVFIFATTEAHKIPVTILSRCQRFDFRRIAHADIVARLRHIADSEGLSIDADILGVIARQAAGGMRDALSLLDQVIAFAGTEVSFDAASSILGVAERRRLFELSAALIARDVDAAIRVVDEVDAFGVDLAHFAAELVGHLRDLALLAVSRSPDGLTTLTDSELAEARSQLEGTDPATIHRMFDITVDAAEQISRSAHARLVLEMALVRLAALEPLYAIEDLVTRLEALADGAKLPPPSTPTAPSTPTPPSPAQAASSSPPPGASASAGDESPSRRVSQEASASAPKDEAPPKTTASPVEEESSGPDDETPSLGALEWREVVEALRRESPHGGELIAGATALTDELGRVRLALDSALLERVDETLIDRLNALCQSKLGRDHEFALVDARKVDDSALASGYSVARDEAAEERRRRATVRAYVLEHEATALVLSTWPGSRVQDVNIPEPPKESTR